MTPERHARIRFTLEHRQPDLQIITDQVHKPQNVAALVRTCDAVGVAHVHMVWPHEFYKPYSGTARGSDRWVDVHRHGSMEEAVAAVRDRGLAVHAAHLSDRARHFRDVDYCQPCALILGNEKDGVGAEAAALADEHLIIPMMGMVESFNVSVAAAIILSEAQRQREAAGLYARRRLSDDDYAHFLVRWGHPQIARFCDERGLAFPPVDLETGEIVDPVGWRKSISSS